MRMVAQLLAAAGILAEGLVVGGLLFVLGGVVDAYSMSLNGADPAHAQVAIRVTAVVLGLALAALGAFIGLVVQCIVVTVAGVALGWAVFLGALLVLGFLLWVQLDEQPLQADGR